MNSKKGGNRSFSSTSGGLVASVKKENNLDASVPANGHLKLEQLNREMGDFSIGPAPDSGWEVISKKKNKGSAATGRQGSSNTAPRVWVQSGQGTTVSGGTGRSSTSNWANSGDSRRAMGRGNTKQQSSSRSWETDYLPPNPSNIAPPLENGWQWSAEVGNVAYTQKNDVISKISKADTVINEAEGVSDDDDALVEDSDEEFSDDYDSDASQKSHESRKKSKWLKGFFEDLDKLTLDEINEQTRQWHCPACHNGPGAIEWYKGLQPLLTHAKTRSTRAKLHRELASLLDEELRRRGTVILSGEAFGRWKGLRESTTDHEIVWPPMVVIMNTILEKDDNDKWIGMGNQELLEYFISYAAKKARHSYGPKGHCGMSMLIFESSAVGYMEAERLHKHFMEQGTNRDAWERSNRVLFCHGSKRQLYGYLARKEDLDVFNKHSQGKTRLKFEIKSYHEMVVNPLKQMSEDNQQLTYLKNRVIKQKEISKALKDTVVAVTQKLRETNEDNRIVRLRTKMQQEESKEMMDYQERFFEDQIEKIHKHTEEKEKEYEKLLQTERAKAKLANSNSGNGEDGMVRKKMIENFIESQVKDVEAFEAEREELIQTHTEKKVALRRKHLAEEVYLEKEFDTELTRLMEKYAPTSFQNTASNS
ncbi:hypothetical protein HPP92_004640 [Vanilla planifolia]|uniref:Protein SUPPRESSOR OF GENE SILENCING 3 n=1 Tax=Vanilla planifolia TaxID=51239 RepID=A0A835VA84_VANPL|nr:hypothetical protein HPP92_004640 [Vanilla planifolia]